MKPGTALARLEDTPDDWRMVLALVLAGRVLYRPWGKSPEKEPKKTLATSEPEG